MEDKYGEALLAYKSGDYESAYKLLVPLVGFQDTRAQNLLGVMYAHGKGLNKDRKRAIEFLNKSVQQGYAPSQYNLGVLYEETGSASEASKEMVHSLYLNAASQGYVLAQLKLAKIVYSKSIDSFQKSGGKIQGYEWARKAAIKGNKDALTLLRRMCRDLNEFKVDKLQKDLIEEYEYLSGVEKKIKSSITQSEIAALVLFGNKREEKGIEEAEEVEGEEEEEVEEEEAEEVEDLFFDQSDFNHDVPLFRGGADKTEEFLPKTEQSEVIKDNPQTKTPTNQNNFMQGDTSENISKISSDFNQDVPLFIGGADKIEEFIPPKTEQSEVIKDSPQTKTPTNQNNFIQGDVSENIQKISADIFQKYKVQYTTFNGSGLVDPISGGNVKIGNGLYLIVEAEGPMLASKAYSVYLENFYDTFTFLAPDGWSLAVGQAMAHEIKANRIVSEDEWSAGELSDSIVRIKNVPPIKVRNLGTRTFDEIPPSELQIVSHIIKQQCGSLSDKNHLLQILDFYKLEYLTSHIELKFQQAIRLQYSYVEEYVEAFWPNFKNKSTTASKNDPALKEEKNPPKSYSNLSKSKEKAEEHEGDENDIAANYRGGGVVEKPLSPTLSKDYNKFHPTPSNSSGFNFIKLFFAALLATILLFIMSDNGLNFMTELFTQNTKQIRYKKPLSDTDFRGTMESSPPNSLKEDEKPLSDADIKKMLKF
jgi:hypothetical protein